MLKSNKKIIVLGILFLLLTGASVPMANAGSVVATLSTDESSKSTAHLGNTTGSYRLVGAVSSSSKYSVQYYVYKGKDSGSCNVEHKHFSYADMSAFDKTYTIDRKTYTLAKSVMYGNKKSEPKKECYANVILSNK